MSDPANLCLILVGCVSKKRSKPFPAKDLFDSTLWNKRRAYAESKGQPWLLLSGKYGLVHPETVLAPYDCYLAKQPAAYRESWSEITAQSVILACRLLGLGAVEVHAGQAYADERFGEILEAAGIEVRRPLAGLKVGEQLHWYKEREGLDHPQKQAQSRPSS